MRKPLFILFLIPLSTVALSHPALARLNTVTGGITTSFDYDKTDYDREDGANIAFPGQDNLTQQLSIGPLFIFESTSSTDGLSLSFNPSFVYDLEDSQSDVNHNFNLAAYRDFTRRLRIELSDDFIYSDDPQQLENETSTGLNRGRRRYWTNNVNFNTAYTYDAGSSFGAGYTYEVLRNDDTGPNGYEDYDRHIVDLSLQHRINAGWNFSLFSNYTRGLFDPPDTERVARAATIIEDISPGITNNVNTEELSNDLTEYELGGTINWIYSSRKTFFLSYDFSATDYDSLLHYNTDLHNLTLGAQYQYSRRLSFDLGAGPSYEKTETFDPNWGYNAHLNFNYDIAEHTSFSAGMETGYDQENFSANNTALNRDQGLTEFWNYSVDLSHAINNDLVATLFASYRDENQENILNGFVNTLETEGNIASLDRETFRDDSTFSRKTYEAGGSLAYTFLQWYTATLRYTYRTQDSEIFNDSYDEHRIYLTLSFQKELWRW